MPEIAERSQTQPDVCRGLSPGDLEAIGAYLTPRLDRLEGGLGAAVCGYILHGDSDSVLARFAGLRGVPHFHNSLSSLQGYGAQPEVRRVFLEAQGWDPAVVRRLGELLVAVGQCGGYARRWPGSANSPAYLRALVHVSITLLQERAIHSASWLLSGPRCLELLSADGGDQAQLVDVVFSSCERDSYRQGRKRLLSMSGLAQVLAAAPARALHGARALDEQGRRGFAAFLGRGELAACPEFAEHLLDTLAHAGARESDAALCALTALDRELQMAGAARLLASDVPARRIAAVRLLRGTATRAAHSLLARHMEVEQLGNVREAMRQALWELNVLTDERQRARADDGQGYVGIDGRWIAIPPVPPLPPEGELPAGLAEGLREAVDQANREAVPQSWAPGVHGPAGPAPFTLYSAAAVGELVAALKGGVMPASTEALRRLTGRGSTPMAVAGAIRRYRSQLQQLLSQPGIAPQHLARALALDQGEGLTAAAEKAHCSWAKLLVARDSKSIPALLLREHARRLGDLRTVLLATAPLGGSEQVLGELLETHPAHWAPMLREAPGPLLWPLVAEHLPLIDQALGLAQGRPPPRWPRISALVLVSLLPVPPRRYLPVLADLALKGRVEERPLARQLLSGAPDLEEHLAAFLKSRDPAGRSAVAAWLGERGERSARACLRAALEVEPIDTVRAQLFAALVALGDDLSDLLSAQRLLDVARTDLALQHSHVGRCVPLNDLPALNWADGSPVPQEVARWLVGLADRLQQACGNAFLDLLLERLEAPSAERLGQLVLASFVTYDTRRPSEEEANAYASQQADRQVQALRRASPNGTEQLLLDERERAFAAHKRLRLKEYVQNGHAHRGILALARRVQPSTLVSVVDRYLREHPRRTPQGKALLDTLAHHGSPLALQLLVAIAGRYKRRYQRQHAQGLLDSLAKQRGWSREQLLDRSIPSGGLAEGGVLTVESDGGAYTVRLDAQLQPVLRNPQGRVVRTLPAGSAGRKALSELRKELKQTVAQQTVRLHEAMCVGRQWRPEELEILLRHPIAGRLCEWLIFAGLDRQGELCASFRPLGDGTLTDAADGSVDLTQFAGIRLAHRAVLQAQQVQAWLQHLQDYRIVPLFKQLERPFLTLAEELAGERAVTEREGYMLDTATLRTEAAKLGYQPGKLGLASRFTRYEKPFPSAGLTAIIDFTGSTLQDRNVPCALIALRFAGRDSLEEQQNVPLCSVPAVLLSEAWNDLRDIAEAGNGFDPEWRKRAC